MHRSRKTITATAVAITGVLAMAGVAAAAHGRSTPRSQLNDDTTTTIAVGGSGGTAVGGSGGSSAIGGTGGTGVIGGTGGTGAVNEPGDDRGLDPIAHDENDDRGGDPIGHETNDDRGNDAVPHDANDDHGNDNASTSSVPSTTLAPSANGVHVFTVAGGSVTVDVENGTLTLVSATPSPGFTIDKSESRSDRIEVEFRGGDVQSRVGVRFDDGRLTVENGDH
jgi:hypothetical protein